MEKYSGICNIEYLTGRKVRDGATNTWDMAAQWGPIGQKNDSEEAVGDVRENECLGMNSRPFSMASVIGEVGNLYIPHPGKNEITA